MAARLPACMDDVTVEVTEHMLKARVADIAAALAGGCDRDRDDDDDEDDEVEVEDEDEVGAPTGWYGGGGAGSEGYMRPSCAASGMLSTLMRSRTYQRSKLMML